MSRAKKSRTKVIYISFATLRNVPHSDVVVKGRRKSLGALRSEVSSLYPSVEATDVSFAGRQRTLVVIDTLNPVAAAEPQYLSAFLSSLLAPSVSLVAVYHADVPLPLARTYGEYEPHPLTLLCHLATAIFRISNLEQAIERRRARLRSLPEPEWGIGEGREGVLIGLRAKDKTRSESGGLVLDLEMRRRSGRAVREKFVLQEGKPRDELSISLLRDHPAFVPVDMSGEPENDTPESAPAEAEVETTFSLALTEKQRRDREQVVLPYFDAQLTGGGGEGGRILYEMGREDDFDDEEDEI